MGHVSENKYSDSALTTVKRMVVSDDDGDDEGAVRI